jgi:hypothetical protein
MDGTQQWGAIQQGATISPLAKEPFLSHSLLYNIIPDCMFFTFLDFTTMIFLLSKVINLASTPQIWRTRSLYLCPQ